MKTIPENVVGLGDFKFSTLHKFMSPIYAELDLNIRKSARKKRRVLYRIVPKFFKRMREYRGIELSQIAKNFFIEEEKLRHFENGSAKSDNYLTFAYCHTCGGYREFDFFTLKLREFQNPSLKDVRDSAALDALKRFGAMMPGVDYQNLHRPLCTILEMRGPTRE